MFPRTGVNGRYAEIFRPMNAALKKVLLCDIVKVNVVTKRLKNIYLLRIYCCSEILKNLKQLSTSKTVATKISRKRLSRCGCYDADTKSRRLVAKKKHF